MKKTQEELKERIVKCLGILHGLTVKELVIVIANLERIIGCKIDGRDPAEEIEIDSLRNSYHSQPTIGKALQLQGLLTSTWIKDLTPNNNKEEKE